MRRLSILIAALLIISGCSSNNSIPPTTTDNNNLLGVVWELTNYTADTGSVAQVAQETKYQILLSTQTSDVQAFIGCVNFSGGEFQITDNVLTLNLGSSDGVLCINQTQEYATQNTAIMSLFQDGDPFGSVPLMFNVSDAQLTLEAADGRTLNFIAAGELMKQL